MNAVSKNIRRLRMRDGFSQEVLAERLNVTRQAVSNWETGKTQPDIDTLISISSVFSVDVTEIIYGEKPLAASPQNRKRLRCAVVIYGAVTIVYILLEIFLFPYLKHLAGTRYIGYPIMIYTVFIRPVFLLCVPLALFSGLSLAYDLRIKKQAVRKAIATASLLFIGLYLMNAANAFLGLYPNLLMFCFVVPLTENPALFLIPGTALFFGLNK